MTVSLRAYLTAGIAAMTISAVTVAPLQAPPPTATSGISHPIELAAAVGPLRPMPKPDIIPTLTDEMDRGIVPSLGSPFPSPPDVPAPAAAADINQAIKNTYNAVEPWVEYAFEVATYAVGWVPYVGWLSGQIMIFYDFGERIARSITFNVADWLFGPVPFIEGLGNVARDSWDALVQLGIDQWNYWLPPLPPLPPLPLISATAQTTTMSAVNPTTDPIAASAVSPHRLAARAEQALGDITTGVASLPAALTKTAEDLAGLVPAEKAVDIASPADEKNAGSSIPKEPSGVPLKAADKDGAPGNASKTLAKAVRNNDSKGGSAKADAHQSSAKKAPKTKGK